MYKEEEEEALPVKMQRPLNMLEIAGMYGIHYKTFKKWITPFETDIGPRTGRYFTVHQVRIIVKKLGLPAL